MCLTPPCSLSLSPLPSPLPLLFAGMNSIIVYVGHEMFEDYFPFSWVGHRDTCLSFLSSNLVGTCMWMLIAYYWYLIGFFVKI
jgi:heparan-alpha-glucosaminide N-acetyltransferase